MPLYNRMDAVRYALKYALAPNSAYHTFPNDCTNFVSQSLFAGGWPMIQGGKTSSSAWYYDSGAWFPGLISPASYTWAGASNFHGFLQGSSRATLASGPDELGAGDVIQMKNSGGVHHTMIVTASGPDLKVSYHSTNRLNYPLAQVVANSPNDTLIYWKLRNVL